MNYANNWVDEVRARANLVDVASHYTKLMPTGKEFKGLCPLHKEKTPSFFVVPDKGFFKCFGCGESGDVFTLVMKAEQVDFLEAARRLAARMGVTIERRRSCRRTQQEEDRLRRQENLRRNLAPGVWESLGIDPALDVFGVGRDVDRGKEFLYLPVYQGRDVPQGWFRYRIHRTNESIRPEFVEMEGDVRFDDVFFTPPDLRTQLVRHPLILVDDPLAAVRLHALGYGAVVAPCQPLDTLPEDASWLNEDALRLLSTHGVQVLYLLIPLGPDSATRSRKLRALYATEPTLVRHGIEPVLIWNTEFARSWDFVASLTGVGQLRALLHNEIFVADLFQLRVSAVVRNLSRGHINQAMAIKKLQPVLAAADASGDRALYHAYVAWAARALGISERERLVRFVPESLQVDAEDDAAEVF